MTTPLPCACSKKAKCLLHHSEARKNRPKPKVQKHEDYVTIAPRPKCHCGKPVHIYEDLDDFTRGMCLHCSTVRCDLADGGKCNA